MTKNLYEAPIDHSAMLARLQNEEDAKRKYHAAKERRRRQKIDSQFQILKSLMPRGMQETDKQGILKSATIYITRVQGLLAEIQKRDPKLSKVIDDLMPKNRSDLDPFTSDENVFHRSEGSQSDESQRNPAFCLKNLLT